MKAADQFKRPTTSHTIEREKACDCVVWLGRREQGETGFGPFCTLARRQTPHQPSGEGKFSIPRLPRRTRICISTYRHQCIERERWRGIVFVFNRKTCESCDFDTCARQSWSTQEQQFSQIFRRRSTKQAVRKLCGRALPNRACEVRDSHQRRWALTRRLRRNQRPTSSLLHTCQHHG